jgi:hypothetical protein
MFYYFPYFPANMAHPIERVEIGSPDGILPGYLIPARAQGRTFPHSRHDTAVAGRMLG